VAPDEGTSGDDAGAGRGAGFHVYSWDRLACYGNRVRGVCPNQRTIRRGEVEQRVLVALQTKVLQDELLEEFSQEFTREMNRLRMEHNASASSARLERRRIDREIGGGSKPFWTDMQARSEVHDGRVAGEENRIGRAARGDRDARPLATSQDGSGLSSACAGTSPGARHEEGSDQAAEAIRTLIEGIILIPKTKTCRSF
jgi:hypothetical protein